MEDEIELDRFKLFLLLSLLLGPFSVAVDLLGEPACLLLLLLDAGVMGEEADRGVLAAVVEADFSSPLDSFS
jgi:hypothetical protein